MKFLLNAAKFEAIKEGFQTIEIRHLHAALRRVHIKDEKTLKVIGSIIGGLNNIIYATKTTFTKSELSEASKTSLMTFSVEVKSFLSNMRKAGFNMDSSISSEATKTNLSFSEKVRNIANFSEKISEKILGQEMAIEAISDHLKKQTGVIKKGQPQGVFLFLGPPGTGKTYLSELMAEYLDDYDNVEVFDMASYQSDNDNSDFVGSADTYGSSRPGRLTTSVARNPRSVIVFDEFEKAHPRVQDSLLPLFSKGILQDQFKVAGIEKDQENQKTFGDLKEFYNDKGILEVDFSESIIIITTNLGQELYSNPDFLDTLQSDPITAKSSILDTISKEKRAGGSEDPAITAPMVSRLSAASVVMFSKLEYENLLQLANNYINDGIKSEELNIGASITFSDQAAIVRMLLLSLGPDFGTRNIKGSIPEVLPFDLISDELQEHYANKDSAEITKVILEISDKSNKQIDKLINDNQNITRSMFRKNQTLRYEKTVNFTKDVLTISFDSIEIKKVARVADFNSSDGFSLDLPTETFDMIAGHNKVKERLKEVVSLMKNPEIVLKHGVDLPKGILLYGTPGTGKTMLAKALANAADLPFIATTGSEIFDMGVKEIKTLFDKARDYAPSIVFIDEIDAIPSRNSSEYARLVVNSLLTEIDGFHGVADEPVFIVAATNLPDILDDALVRSGRIEYHIEVPFLDRDARGFFIDKMLNHKAFKSEDMNRADLIQLSTGMNGSQLERVKRECILTMIRDECSQVTNENFIEQMNFVKYGHKLELDESVLRMEETAVHEAGHLVAQWYLAPATKIEQITVMARANFLGMVSYEHGDNPEYSRPWLMGQTCVALAGREAQIMKHGERSLDSGASSDLNAVMHYANLAIVEYGMDTDLYNISVSSLRLQTNVIRKGVEMHDGVNYFNAEVESAVKSWVSEATDKTRSLLTEHWDEIEKITEAVLEKEVLYNEEISDILGERPKN